MLGAGRGSRTLTTFQSPPPQDGVSTIPPSLQKFCGASALPRALKPPAFMETGARVELACVGLQPTALPLGHPIKVKMVPREGVEPSRPKTLVSETSASARFRHQGMEPTQGIEPCPPPYQGGVLPLAPQRPK